MALIVQTCSNQVTVTQPVGDYSTTVSWVSNGTSNQYMSTGGSGSTTVISGLIPGMAYSFATVDPTTDAITTSYSKSFMISKDPVCTNTVTINSLTTDSAQIAVTSTDFPISITEEAGNPIQPLVIRYSLTPLSNLIPNTEYNLVLTTTSGCKSYVGFRTQSKDAIKTYLTGMISNVSCDTGGAVFLMVPPLNNGNAIVKLASNGDILSTTTFKNPGYGFDYSASLKSDTDYIITVTSDGYPSCTLKLTTTQCQTCPVPPEYGCSVDWIKVFFIMVFALLLFVLKWYYF